MQIENNESVTRIFEVLAQNLASNFFPGAKYPHLISIEGNQNHIFV